MNPNLIVVAEAGLNRESLGRIVAGYCDGKGITEFSNSLMVRGDDQVEISSCSVDELEYDAAEIEKIREKLL